VHSVLSNGGELTPRQLVQGACAAGLDFLAITEHNAAGEPAAWSEHATADLLVIPGQEVTTRSGHWLALGVCPGQVVDWRYDARDDVVRRHLDDVHRAGGLCVAAHPHAPYESGTFLFPYDGFDVVEVWNGPWRSCVPWQADNETALAEWGSGLGTDAHHGRWRPMMGNSDTHLHGQIGVPQLVVLADELSAHAILDGIRAGRSWVAASGAVGLSFTVSAGRHSAGIGARLETGRQPVVARVEVSGVPSGTVSLHTGRGEAYRAPLPDSGSGTVEWHAATERPAFVRIEVRDEEGRMAALTNPVILA
jgi:hypothetical protein